MSNKDIEEILDEVYRGIPHYEPSEEEIEDQYRQYEAFLKKEEISSLDLDYDL